MHGSIVMVHRAFCWCCKGGKKPCNAILATACRVCVVIADFADIHRGCWRVKALATVWGGVGLSSGGGMLAGLAVACSGDIAGRLLVLR